MKYSNGEKLFECNTWEDGKFHLGVITIVASRQAVDSKNRNRGIEYKVKSLNFTRNGKTDHSIKEKELDNYFHRSAVEAVSQRLAGLFNEYRSGTPEKRLLESIFGQSTNINITMSELPKVIRNLQEFLKLFEEAFRMDAECLGEEKKAKEAEEFKKTHKEEDKV